MILLNNISNLIILNLYNKIKKYHPEKYHISLKNKIHNINHH